MIEQYINKAIACDCGKPHKSRVDTIVIRKGGIEKELIDYLKQNGYQKLTVVCDGRSYRVAGKNVCQALDQAGIAYRLHQFQEDPLTPDEHAIGNLLLGADLGCDLFLAVGSGTVGDICRYVSAAVGKPFCTVGTAPSMDGYISNGSALIYNNLKVNFITKSPNAVFFDPDILANAPMDMIASGTGDLLGKINCLTDWRLAKIICGEWHCEFIAGIVDAAIQKTVSAYEGIVQRNSEAVATLLEALLLSGVGMDYAGNSRPASGCEHHMSHFWEMRFLQEGRPAVFHGTKVGIGTVIALKAYEYLTRLSPDFEALIARPVPTFAQWEKTISDVYLGAAQEIVELEKKAGKNDIAKRNERLAVIRENWDAIQNLAVNAPKADTVRHILETLGAPVRPDQIEVPREMAWQAIVYAKEIRDRYTILQLLWDLGELENFADLITEEYYGENR